MTITLRRIKQAPLSIDELDDNFAELDERLIKLEKLLKQQEPIAEIVQEENTLKFNSSSGQEIGRVIFPPQLLRYKGIFNQNTRYEKGDLIIHKNKVYQAICITTIDMPFKSEEWNLVLEMETLSEKNVSNSSVSSAIPKYLESELPKPIPGDLVISITNDGAKLLIGQEKEWLCLTSKK